MKLCSTIEHWGGNGSQLW